MLDWFLIKSHTGLQLQVASVVGSVYVLVNDIVVDDLGS